MSMAGLNNKPVDMTILFGGLELFFLHLLGTIIPTDGIFQRGGSTTNQI